MDVRNNPYTRLVALEQGLREILNDAGMTMPQTAAAIFFLADVDAVEKCLLAKERNKDAHDLLQGLIELRDKADESIRGPVVKTMTEADVAKMERNHKEMQKLATELIELIEVLKPHIGDPEPSIANPLQILSAGNAAIADAQKALSDTLAAGNQALCNGERKSNADRRVESKFSEPDDSLTDGAIEYLKKSFHKLSHAGTAQVNHVIAAAVKDGFQRNAVEWALVRMQEYGWIKLSIPVWGGVIGNHHCEAKHQSPVQEPKPNRWYFGTQEYNLRLTEYFYNPSYCRRCSELIGDYGYDRDECHECRSPKGKLAELEVAIKCQHLYGNENDNPERIREWPTIRAYLRDKFGPDRTNIQLWEWMTDYLRVLGWNQEQWLRMKYDEFIELLKSGLLKDQPESKGGLVTESGGSLVEKPVEVATAQIQGEEDTETETREERIAALDIRHKHAILAFELAENAIASPGERFTREKAWIWVEEHYEDYRFPSKQAFMDYVTQARGKLGENVNQPRRGRSGRSVVRQSEI